MKSIWQHENAKLYAVRSNTFGKITGAAGPFDALTSQDLDSCEYGPAIVQWVERAIATHTLRRVNPDLATGVTRAIGRIAP
ncbi:MAG: hypothetical protein JW993_14995 [Sedimentisphaerales bacterium]|nr:hypothetical protein [Sedimentisphaerales bacterium]